MKLLLVCGGQSTEHAVSRMSCVNIYKNADKTKYDIKVAGITKEGKWYELAHTDFTNDNWLEGAQPIADNFAYLKSFDVVFPVLHGLYGDLCTAIEMRTDFRSVIRHNIHSNNIRNHIDFNIIVVTHPAFRTRTCASSTRSRPPTTSTATAPTHTTASTAR